MNGLGFRVFGLWGFRLLGFLGFRVWVGFLEFPSRLQLKCGRRTMTQNRRTAMISVDLRLELSGPDWFEFRSLPWNTGKRKATQRPPGPVLYRILIGQAFERSYFWAISQGVSRRSGKCASGCSSRWSGRTRASAPRTA